MNCARCASPGFSGSQFCWACGGSLASFAPAQSNWQGVTALILGLVSLVMCGAFTAIPGMIIGWMGITAAREGRASQSSGTMSKIGFWISAAATVLTIFFCLLFVGMSFLSF
jgi:uncharacterized membrane protein